jgi:hypothetical protein
VTLRDENTNFFHANATIKHNRNSIMSMEDSSGQLISRHEEKEKKIWEAYKERLGTSEFTHMYFNLAELLQRQEGLEILQEPFQKEEIDSMVQNLPMGESPGPDGFNTDIMRKCWHVICEISIACVKASAIVQSTYRA